MVKHKHCAQGTCKSDSRYPDKLEPGVISIHFPKPGHTRDEVRPGVHRTELNKKAQAEKLKKQNDGYIYVEEKIFSPQTK